VYLGLSTRREISAPSYCPGSFVKPSNVLCHLDIKIGVHAHVLFDVSSTRKGASLADESA
jgi:hypothetical protein